MSASDGYYSVAVEVTEFLHPAHVTYIRKLIGLVSEKLAYLFTEYIVRTFFHLTHSGLL